MQAVGEGEGMKCRVAKAILEEGTKPRKVLMSMEQFENMMEEGY